MKTIRERVKKLLEDNFVCRDDDRWLAGRIWTEEQSANSHSSFAFISDYANGRYTSYDTITRHRRKLQAEFPELRGIKYTDRITRLEKLKRDEFRKGNTPTD